MTLGRQTKFSLWVVAAMVIAGASYFVGTTLRPGEQPYYVFDTGAPAYAAPSGIAATSPGGFTGFGETDASASRVVVSGRVVDMTEDSITLESTAGQRTNLRFGDSPSILRLETGTQDELRPGVTVAVRLNEAGDAVEGVLVLTQP